MDKSDYILFSGGAKGSEAAFGETAEKFEIEEVNFTFDDHLINRERMQEITESRRTPEWRHQP
ncbi:MAG: hypothetical protein VX910_06295 [Candidatus Latescibacterota bacterium]|nr:hypothetical protein [Candidatus Latescibacterota bacterium]